MLAPAANFSFCLKKTRLIHRNDFCLKTSACPKINHMLMIWVPGYLMDRNLGFLPLFLGYILLPTLIRTYDKVRIYRLLTLRAFSNIKNHGILDRRIRCDLLTTLRCENWTKNVILKKRDSARRTSRFLLSRFRTMRAYFRLKIERVAVRKFAITDKKIARGQSRSATRVIVSKKEVIAE